MQRIDSDQLEAQFTCRQAGELQPFTNDLQSQPPARQRARTGVGDLALTDIAVDIADRYFQRGGSASPSAAADADAVFPDLLDFHMRKVGRDVGLDVSGWVVHLVE